MIRRLYILLIIVLASCVEPFYPEFEGEDSILVVDGLVTNSSEESYVKLRLSAGLERQVEIPVTNAAVIVSDDLGNTYNFQTTFTCPGIYTYSGFTGVTGRSYSLEVFLPNGKRYYSEPQLLQQPAPVDSIFYEITEMPTTDPDEFIRGASFYLQQSPEAYEDTYSLYYVTETYQFHLDFRLYYIHRGNGMEAVTEPPSKICWKTTSFDGAYLFKGKAHENPVSQTIPLHFVPFNSKTFFEKYHLDIKQIRVSEEVFSYYYQVNEQQNSGSMFAIQPFNIKGNVHLRGDTEEIALGCFVVGGIARAQKFFPPPRNAHFSFSRCVAKTDGIGFWIQLGGTPDNPLYFTKAKGGLGLTSKECVLCSGNQASDEKPDFWED